MQAVKKSLIEREVAGSLSRAQSQLLRLQAMRSPALDAEIEAARRLAQAAPAAPSSRLLFAFLRHRPAFSLILSAAAILLVAASVALFYPSWRRGGKPTTGTQAALRPQPAAATANAQPIVLFIPALHLRGEETIPVLTLGRADPAKSDVTKSKTPVELQIEIRGEAPRSVSLYRASSIVAAAVYPALREAGSIRYLSLLIERDQLVPGRYRIEVAPRNESESVDRRSFLVREIASKTP